MDDIERQAMERFGNLYREMLTKRSELEAAAKWIADNFAPYQVGEVVKIPMFPPMPNSGKQLTITKVALNCDQRSGKVHWAISGKEGYFRRPVEDQLPEAVPPEQPGLF